MRGLVARYQPLPNGWGGILFDGTDDFVDLSRSRLPLPGLPAITSRD